MRSLKFALLALCAALFIGCGDTRCQNSVAYELASPGRGRKALVFNRDCGATTGISTQLSILPAGTPLGSDAGNALAVDEGTLVVRWSGDDSLIVELGGRRAYKKESVVAGVTITYRQ